MRKSSLYVFAVLLLIMTDAAETRGSHDPLIPDSFAFGMSIRTQGKGALYEVELPMDVYRGVTRGDLGDMRVFNGRDEIVPHAIRSPESTTVRVEQKHSDLPFFPVPGESAGPDSLRVRVDATRGGAIVEVRTTEPSIRGKAKSPYWIVDATALDAPLSGLEFSWSPETVTFLERLDLARSDDLNDWHLVTSTVMARLDFEGKKLEHSSMKFSIDKPRYLRLSFKRPVSVQLEGLRAVTQSNRRVSRPALQWHRVSASMDPLNPGIFLFDAEAYLPAEQARILPPRPNRLITASLHSSIREEDLGRRQWHGMIYDLNMQGERITMPHIDLPRMGQRFWRLVPEKSEAGLGGLPVVEIGWRPDRVVFMAGGDGPFRLAFGSAAVEPAVFKVEKLLRQAGPGRRPIVPLRASAGAVYPLGGQERLAPVPPGRPWQKIILWGVLVLGVALIGWMAVSLLRQMKEEEGDGGAHLK
jgi:hypothetical protein